MDKKTKKFNVDDLKDAFTWVDNTNYLDFSSLEPIIKRMYRDIDGKIFYEIVSYLQLEFGFNCDAELFDITEYEIEELVEYINNNSENEDE